jgi:hypothetical protein
MAALFLERLGFGPGAKCPRAFHVAKRQLALYQRLRSDGAIRHNYLFFTASGDPIESLLYTADRWRSTLRR